MASLYFILTILTSSWIHVLHSQLATPAPSNPSPITCGGSVIMGEFNNAIISFEIRMPYYGDMFFYINGFTVTSISAYYKLSPNNIISTSPAGESSITISKLPANSDIIIEVDGMGKSAFQALSHCTALTPTIAPPTPRPTTITPTLRPTTPAPTNPGKMQCGIPISGAFNGQQMMLSVQMPYLGKISFRIDTDFILSSIRAFDTNNPFRILAVTPAPNVNILTVVDVEPFSDITFEVDGIGKGTFTATTECINLAPTPPPTYAPPITCGDATIWGNFDNQPQWIEVRLIHDGAMVFDITGSFGFDIHKISVYDKNDLSTPIQQTSSTEPNKLFISYITGNANYMFKIDGTGNGLLMIDTTCSTSKPTANPTKHPITPKPTNNPTIAPPTTPRPTQGGHILCGDPKISGMLSIPEQTYFDVRMANDGDLQLTVIATVRSEITGITAYDTHDPAQRVIATSNSGSITIPNLKKNADVTFQVHGTGNGLFIATTSCNVAPTSIPTQHPTTAIPTWRTLSPTGKPSVNPTKSPITPSPTHPGLIQCGVPIIGDFSGKELIFGATMPYQGDITFVITGVSITNIRAFSATDPSTPVAISNSPQLNIYGLPANTYIFIKANGVGNGRFNAILQCTAANGITNPIQPTLRPTGYPTTSPLSVIPVTINPPNPAQITPSPTHPGLIFCGESASGDFNGGEIIFGTTMPYHGDITFVITGFVVTMMKAYSAMDPSTVFGVSNTQQLNVQNVEPNTYVMIMADGTGKGRFNALLYCTQKIAPIPTPKPTATLNILPTTPTTPSPIQPGIILCEIPTSGSFNGQELLFGVTMPYRGDITFIITGISVTFIRAYNAMDPASNLAVSVTEQLTVSNLMMNDFIMISVEGTGNGIFRARLHCITPIPTMEPIGNRPQIAPNPPLPTPVPTVPHNANIPTQRPTQPGLIQCGVGISGDFNGQELVFSATMPYQGDFTFVITGVAITTIKAYSAMDPSTSVATSVTPSLTIFGIPAMAEIMLKVTGTGKGTFNALLSCKSLNPIATPIPTTPSNVNSVPTAPITPAPTQPGLIQCEIPSSGTFNGQELKFGFKMPYRGDITFIITGISVTMMKAYNYAIDPSPTLGLSLSSQLTVSNLDTNDYIMISVEGTGTGTYNARLHCITPIPTMEPTVLSGSRPQTVPNPINPIPTPLPTTPLNVVPIPTAPVNPILNPVNPINPVNPNITPAPTQPGLIQCDIPFFGEFNGESLVFGFKMPNQGDITFVVTGFTVTYMKAYNAIDPSRTLAVSVSPQLTVSNLNINDYVMIMVDGTGGIGTFNALLFCVTPIPTMEPTPTRSHTGVNSLPTPQPTDQCQGLQVRDQITKTCACPKISPTGVLLTECVIPFIQNPVTCLCEIPGISFTPRPTTATTVKPTGNPTKRPTLNPTQRPTLNPTLRPSQNPTQRPTLNPTKRPTLNPVTPKPTPPPTRHPTQTTRPTQNPITPSPTHPGFIQCAAPVFGDFNGKPMEFSVTMPYKGDMTFVITGISITSIKAYKTMGGAGNNIVSTLATTTNQQLTVPNIDAFTDVMIVVDGTGKSKFNALLYCITSEPTSHPTTLKPTLRPTLNPTLRPTVRPTNFPTKNPTKYPTVPPTVRPTNNPTSRPTLRPSMNPTLRPSMNPTMRPSSNPTKRPTNIPTQTPVIPVVPIINGMVTTTKGPQIVTTVVGTQTPSNSVGSNPAATPAPTNPGRSECGSTTFGDFNGEPMIFKILMPYNGDVSFFITGIAVTNIKAFDIVNPINIKAETPIAGTNSLTVFNILANTDMVFVVNGNGKSRFNVMIQCKPADPNDVSSEPTVNPIISAATTGPQIPTNTPIQTTTLIPTTAGGVHPITPAPTQPPEMQCGVQMTGEFNARKLIFRIMMPYKGDITFFISGFTITTISAYNFLYPTTILAQSPMVGINSLSVHEIEPNTGIIFKVDGVGKGQFDALSQCIPAVVVHKTKNPMSATVELQCEATPENQGTLIGDHEPDIHHILLTCCGATITSLSEDVSESGQFTKDELREFGDKNIEEVVLAQAIKEVESVDCNVLKVNEAQIVENSIAEIDALLTMENVTEPPVDAEDVIDENGGKTKGSPIFLMIASALIALVCCCCAIAMCMGFRKRTKRRLAIHRELNEESQTSRSRRNW